MTKKDDYIERLELALEVERAANSMAKKDNQSLLEIAGEWRDMAYDNNDRRYKLKVENEKLVEELRISNVRMGKYAQMFIDMRDKYEDFLTDDLPLEKELITPRNFTMTIHVDPPEFWEEVQ